MILLAIFMVFWHAGALAYTSNLQESIETTCKLPKTYKNDTELIKYFQLCFQAGDIQLGYFRDVVLVLGDVESGKTSLVKVLSNYQPKKKQNVVKESSLEPVTILPKLYFNEESKVPFYDCSGFSDGTNVYFDVVTKYFWPKLLGYVKTVKIILAVKFEQLKDLNSFTAFMERAVYFLGDPAKFEGALLLVVTDVPGEADLEKILEVENMIQKVSSVNELKSLAALFQRDRIHLSKNLAGYSPDDRNTNERQLRLAIGRSIDKLSSMRTRTVKFGVQFSQKTKQIMNQHISEVTEVIDLFITSLLETIKESYLELFDSEDMSKVVDNFPRYIEDVDQIYTELSRNVSLEHLLNVLVNYQCTLVPKKRNFLHIKAFEIIELYRYFTSPDLTQIKVKWMEVVTEMKEFLKFNVMFFRDLNNFELTFEQMVTMTHYIEMGVDALVEFGMITPETAVGLYKYNIEKHEDLINEIIPKKKATIECSETTLRFTSTFVTLKSVIHDLRKQSCEYETLEIFASNTIYINDCLERYSSSRHRKQLSIIAPVWIYNVRKPCNMNLNGAHRAYKHKRDRPKTDDKAGKHGAHGYDGAPAASFLGAAVKMINFTGVVLTAIGGDGSNGKPGKPGLQATGAAYEDVCNKMRTNVLTVVNSIWGEVPHATETDDYIELRYDNVYRATRISCLYAVYKQRKTTNSGRGGYGGDAGNPGAAGEVIIYNREEVGIKILAAPGQPGKPGVGGKSGFGCHIKKNKAFVSCAKPNRPNTGDDNGDVGMTGQSAETPTMRRYANKTATIKNFINFAEKFQFKYLRDLKELLTGQTTTVNENEILDTYHHLSDTRALYNMFEQLEKINKSKTYDHLTAIILSKIILLKRNARSFETMQVRNYIFDALTEIHLYNDREVTFLSSRGPPLERYLKEKTKLALYLASRNMQIMQGLATNIGSSNNPTLEESQLKTRITYMNLALQYVRFSLNETTSETFNKAFENVLDNRAKKAQHLHMDIINIENDTIPKYESDDPNPLILFSCDTVSDITKLTSKLSNKTVSPTAVYEAKRLVLSTEKLLRMFNTSDKSKSNFLFRELRPTLISITVNTLLQDRINNIEDNLRLVQDVFEERITQDEEQILIDLKEKMEHRYPGLQAEVNFNIVGDKFEDAMMSYIQLTFPQKLDAQIQTIKDATNKLSKWSEMPSLHEYPTKLDVWTKTFPQSNPFFVWNYEQYTNQINELLAGKEVYLHANILQETGKLNAIKYNDIFVTFRTTDPKFQSKLMAELKPYKVLLTHLGDSVYKCSNYYYLIRNHPITYSFNAFDPNCDRNIPLLKTTQGNFMRSPYAFWKLQIADPFKLNPVNITKYPLDIYLQGYGTYVTETRGMCSKFMDQLQQIYNFIRL